MQVYSDQWLICDGLRFRLSTELPDGTEGAEIDKIAAWLTECSVVFAQQFPALYQLDAPRGQETLPPEER